ncbi:MAG: PqqD family peptide modification chaperone [Blastocatellia bacterium]|nr:PqqD family peptide modification chaperone [Blastocatellia bacterium]
MKKNTNLTTPKNQIKPISLKNNVLVQELEKELLLYDLKRDKAFCLNETSLMIWNLCDGNNSVEDICREFGVQLKTNIPIEMIWLALDKLKSEQLLGNYEEINIDFSNLSRREVIKKVGLSTVVALPFVSAVIAPKAAAAQSQAVCSSQTTCLCPDASCVVFGNVALLQNPCTNPTCSGTGGNNCLCVGNFFCSNTPEVRFGMCGLV